MLFICLILLRDMSDARSIATAYRSELFQTKFQT